MAKTIISKFLRITLSFTFILLIGKHSAFSQKIEKESITRLVNSFNNLSGKGSVFKLKFIEKDSVLIFQKEKMEEQVLYRVLIKHIHPEGIYIDRNLITRELVLKIISMDNGNLFIKTESGKNPKLSEIINVISFAKFNRSKEKAMNEFVENMREVLRTFNKQEESEEIFITDPKGKKN
jgi:hypothetical protein